jgi:hypothetical protein
MQCYTCILIRFVKNEVCRTCGARTDCFWQQWIYLYSERILRTVRPGMGPIGGLYRVP